MSHNESIELQWLGQGPLDVCTGRTARTGIGACKQRTPGQRVGATQLQ